MTAGRHRSLPVIIAVAGVVAVLATSAAWSGWVLSGLPGLRQKIEHHASEAVGTPVRVGTVTLAWQGLDPGIRLHQVALLDRTGRPAVKLKSVEVDADIGALLHGHWQPSRVTVSGLTLTATIDDAGKWSVAGLPTAMTKSDGSLDRRLHDLRQLSLRHGVLVVVDARIGARPLRFGLHATLDRPDPANAPQGYRLAFGVTPPPRIADGIKGAVRFNGALLHRSSWNGHWRLSASGIRRLPWLRLWLPSTKRLVIGDGRLQARGEMTGGHIRGGKLTATTADVTLVGATGAQPRLHALHAALAFRAESAGWRVHVTKLALDGPRGRWNAAPADIRLQRDAGGSKEWQVDLARLHIETLLPWLTAWPRTAKVLTHVPNLHGDIEEFSARIAPGQGARDDDDAQSPRISAHANLVDVGWAAHDGTPGVSGLSGQIESDADSGHFHFTSAPTIDAPRRLAVPVAFDTLDGTLTWQRHATGWNVAATALQWRVLGASGHGDFTLGLPATGPTTLNLAMDLKAQDAAKLKPLMPLHWGKGLRQWLKRAVVRAPVVSGHLAIRGPLPDFPFDTPATAATGHWSLHLAFADATLDYDPEWPAGQHLDASLQFRGNGVRASASAGQSDGVALHSATASIADFDTPVLTVDATATGDAADFYRLAKDSPLRKDLSGLLDHSTARGPATAKARLEIPLDSDQPTRVIGTLDLDDARMTYQGLQAPVTAIHGSLGFDRDGLTAAALSAKYLATPVTVRLAPTPSGGAPTQALEIGFRADPQAADGIARLWLPDWLRAHMTGASDWQLSVPLGASDTDELELRTSLSGTAVDLPAPLAKPAGEALPLIVQLGENDAGPRLIRIDGGARFGLSLRLDRTDDRVLGAGLRLGKGPPASATDKGVRLTGSPAELDLGGWIALLQDARARQSTLGKNAATPDSADGPPDPTPRLPFLGADLHIGDLHWGPVHVRQVRAVAIPVGSGVRVALDGPGARGVVEWDKKDHNVRGRMQALKLERFAQTAATDSAADSTPAAVKPLDPSHLPTWDIKCAALTIGDYALGTFELRSARETGGQRLEKLEVSGKSVRVSASGDWTRVDGASSARVGFSLSLDRLADALHAFGYTRNVTARHATFRGSAQWLPNPAGLDLSQVQGKLRLRLEDGTLKPVKPGVGRAFGLLNLYALPRRLSLDFKDVVSKGMAYDHITGDFTLGKGQARTDNLHIGGPALSMDVRGRIGLAAKDFDETVKVYPDIASGVTIGAVLLGGPIAGGIALLMQQLVGKALDKLTEVTYQVTGSWDNPQVTRAGESSSKTQATQIEDGAATTQAKP